MLLAATNEIKPRAWQFFHLRLPDKTSSLSASRYVETFSTGSDSETFLRNLYPSICPESARMLPTKSPLPRIRSSPFSRASFFLPKRPDLFPPVLRTRPPPCSSRRFPCSIPFLTNSLYLLRATFLVLPKWSNTSSMVFSAKGLFLTPVPSAGATGQAGLTGLRPVGAYAPVGRKGKRQSTS